MKRFLSLILLLLPLFVMGISLEQAVELAEKNNLELKSAEEATKISRANYRNVKGGIYPNIKLEGGFELQRTDLADRFEATEVEEGSGSLQLRIDQLLFSTDLFNGLKVAKIYNETQRNQYELKLKDVILRTKQMYYQVLLAQEILEVNRESVSLSRIHYVDAVQKFDAGLISKYDMLKAELNAIENDPKLLKAQNDLEIVRINFMNYLGLESWVPLTDSINLTDDEISEVLSKESDITKRLEYKLSKNVVQMEKINWQNEKVNFLPTISAYAAATEFSGADGYEIESEDWGQQYKVGVGFSMSLFSGFSNSAKKQEAKHKHKQTTYDKEDLKDKLELGVSSAQLQLLHSITVLQVAQTSNELARITMGLANERYEGEVGTELEIQDALLAYRASSLEVVVAEYDLIMAYEHLLKAKSMN